MLHKIIGQDSWPTAVGTLITARELYAEVPVLLPRSSFPPVHIRVVAWVLQGLQLNRTAALTAQLIQCSSSIVGNLLIINNLGWIHSLLCIFLILCFLYYFCTVFNNYMYSIHKRVKIRHVWWSLQEKVRKANLHLFGFVQIYYLAILCCSGPTQTRTARRHACSANTEKAWLFLMWCLKEVLVKWWSI